MRILRELEYARVDEHKLTLDLYLPDAAGAGPRPLVVWVHGGAYRAGDKDPNRAALLVERGYASASINYRLSGQAKFPAQIHDCKAAVRWLRAHAREYDFDPQRFGAWGSSAGGHLVALLGTSHHVPAMEGRVGNHLDQDSGVQAVCDWFGPSDLLQINAQALADSVIDHDAPDSPESELLGGPLQTMAALAATANPLAYIRGDQPPFLIMHGDHDRVVPWGQSHLLYEALRQAGADVTFHTVAGAGHGASAFATPATLARVAAFFDQKLAAATQGG